MEGSEDLVDLHGMRVDEELGLLGHPRLDDSALLIKHH